MSHHRILHCKSFPFSYRTVAGVEYRRRLKIDLHGRLSNFCQPAAATCAGAASASVGAASESHWKQKRMPEQQAHAGAASRVGVASARQPRMPEQSARAKKSVRGSEAATAQRIHREEDRNEQSLPNAIFLVSSRLDPCEDAVSQRRNRFFVFQSLRINYSATSAICLDVTVIKIDRNYHQCPIGTALRTPVSTANP